jgi:hypothetical protein
VDRSLQRLHGELAAGSLRGWDRALADVAAFWKRPFQNAFLIRAQLPEATALHDRLEWRYRGREVRRGERPLSVLVPAEADCRTFGPNASWMLEPVFDLSQTEGRPPARKYRAGDEEILDWLERFAVHQGIRVIRDDLPPGPGYSLGGWIVVERRLDVPRRLAAMLPLLVEELLRLDSEPTVFARDSIVRVVVTALRGGDASVELLPDDAAPSGAREVSRLLWRVHGVAARILGGVKAECVKDLPC